VGYKTTKMDSNKNIENISKAISEIREYVSDDKPIVWSGYPMPPNHLYCVRGKYCEFAEHQNSVDAYLYPETDAEIDRITYEVFPPETSGVQPEPAKGTITWYPKSEKPENLEKNTFGFWQSDYILVTDGVNISHSKYMCGYDGVLINWYGYNNMPFTPTHWAYINYPTNL
jgi:hypothetical protein